MNMPLIEKKTQNKTNQEDGKNQKNQCMNVG